MRLQDPWVLLLLCLLPVFWILLRWMDKKSKVAVRFPDLTHLKQAPRSTILKWRHSIKLLRLLVLALLIFALARPQLGRTDKEIRSEGIAIALVIDCSESMSIQDFRPNRLEASKQVIKEFVDSRKSDEICTVIYGKHSLVACPLTLDYGVLKDFVESLNFQDLGREFISQTAIGLGLANALRQLEKSEAKSKVVILLTDGRNNAGDISPLKAAELAKTLGIKVYTIGMGKPRNQRQFINNIWQFTGGRQELDEDTLTKIAEISGGKFFRASNEKKLRDIYEEIDELETHEIKITEYDSFDEKMFFPTALALVFLLFEILLGYTRFAKLP